MKAFLKNVLNDELMVDKIMKEFDPKIQKFKITSDPKVFREYLKRTDKKTYSELGRTQEIRSFEYVIIGDKLMVINPRYFDENSTSVLLKNTSTIERKFNGDIISDQWDFMVIIYVPDKMI